MSRVPHSHPLTLFAAVLGLWLPLAALPARAEVEVVTTLSAYGAIAQEVGGDRVHVKSISRGDEDAHFVQPKPSFALMLRSADLFVTTGLDLELWAPTLVDKSGNKAIREGSPGYVNASQGVTLLDVPSSADRSAGDVHLFGNPHVFTTPINAKIIAANIAAGLQRVDPEGADEYRHRLADFQRRIDEALYGKELVDLLGTGTLEPLARQGRLIPFLQEKELGGHPLIDRLGGWLGKARPLFGTNIVTYHKNWIYLTDMLGLHVVDYVEPKPGIPPSARHVHDLVATIQQQKIRILLAASYFQASEVEAIAERTGCAAVRVPLGPVEGVPATYAELFDLWLDGLLSALGPQGA